MLWNSLKAVRASTRVEFTATLSARYHFVRLLSGKWTRTLGPPDATTNELVRARVWHQKATPTPATDTDVLVRREPRSTIFLFTPLTDAGQAWIHEHVAADAAWLGNSLVVDQRYSLRLAAAMADDGLILASPEQDPGP